MTRLRYSAHDFTNCTSCGWRSWRRGFTLAIQTPCRKRRRFSSEISAMTVAGRHRFQLNEHSLPTRFARLANTASPKYLGKPDRKDRSPDRLLNGRRRWLSAFRVLTSDRRDFAAIRVGPRLTRALDL